MFVERIESLARHLTRLETKQTVLLHSAVSASRRERIRHRPGSLVRKRLFKSQCDSKGTSTVQTSPFMTPTLVSTTSR